MANSEQFLRHVARCLVALMIGTCGHASAAQAQEATPVAAALTSGPVAKVSTDETKALPDAPESQNGQGANPGGEAGPPQQSGENARPLGTAAAPYTRPTGVTGSRPAGAVIAPAKQRRIRTILISVGVIAAAGIAVGTVAALSHGSPSRP
jgi:hypothetical protein